MKKTLITILIAGALALTSCKSENSFYEYQGEIGEEKVNFEQAGYLLSEPENYLTITKQDGKVITYSYKRSPRTI